jgi:hypothetical protein
MLAAENFQKLSEKISSAQYYSSEKGKVTMQINSATEVDFSFENTSLAAPGFTQLKPEAGHSMVVSFLVGKMKASPYHWLSAQKKGYRCTGETCPACKAGITQSWSAVALAIAYTGADSGQIGYIPLSRTAYREVGQLNGGKRQDGTYGVYLCNVKVRWDGENFSFKSDNGPARWTQSAALRKQVEEAKASPQIERLLLSKLYEALTDHEWEMVLKHGSPIWEED